MKSNILCHINDIPIYRRKIPALPANRALAQRARALRKAGILSEVLFWLQVRNGSFHNIDFDRQRVIGNYIADFYVKALGLVIEIDGSSHDNKVEYDKMREQFLVDQGVKVYRIPDIRVKQEIGVVMEELECFIIENFSVEQE